MSETPPALETLTGRPPSLGVAAGFFIAVTSGPDTGKRLELTRGSALVGTASACDLKLNDRRVSRQHLRLACTVAGLELTDLGSRNGTLLNGARVKSAVLALGSRIQVGDSELQVTAAGAPELTGELFGLVGQSGPMRALMRELKQVAPSDTTVLMVGETGSGKEAAARALHAASGRKGRLVVFDCASVSVELAGSELFGHAAGAFTGARAAREGAVDRAAGGTLFLDEVAELPPSTQPELLRLLDRKEVHPVGGDAHHRVDVRVVAATHRDLEAEVRAGRFRQDLYFRLAVLTVKVPPLRERASDIPLLAQRLLAEAGRPSALSERALEALGSYAWPGNVRELRNVLLRAAALDETPQPGGKKKKLPADFDPAELSLDYRRAREAMVGLFEREYLRNLLEQHQGNVSAAAKSAKIARSHLYRLLTRHGLV
ncbi:MAG: sigma 54-dependent Fis family transcriptional regulator [Archangiaceae bacterium]|nr:sigma 54-dependent Fis family transcriptional regulator [Archangiaceae bacterium]